LNVLEKEVDPCRMPARLDAADQKLRVADRVQPQLEPAAAVEDDGPDSHAAFEFVETNPEIELTSDLVVLDLDAPSGVGCVHDIAASPENQRISSPMASAVSIRSHAEGFGVRGPRVTSHDTAEVAHTSARRATSRSSMSTSMHTIHCLRRDPRALITLLVASAPSGPPQLGKTSRGLTQRPGSRSNVQVRSLPPSDASLLVRTYFADAAAWHAARSAALSENDDGFRAYVEVVDDPSWDGATTADVRAATLSGEHAAVLFIADRVATEGDFPILVIDLSPEARSPFRCIARELWGVDNNLNLANIDWDEFAANADSDGIHRGFSE
jgi:hypothetical protein